MRPPYSSKSNLYLNSCALVWSTFEDIKLKSSKIIQSHFKCRTDSEPTFNSVIILQTMLNKIGTITRVHAHYSNKCGQPNKRNDIKAYSIWDPQRSHIELNISAFSNDMITMQ